MAKKKKAAVNPARGYATVSAPSKAKPPDEENTAPAVEAVTSAEITIGPSATSGTNPSALKPSENAAQQTPEELEAQLERDELQWLVEKHSAKVRRDASRLDSKVRTDCRILRAQAQYLPLAPFLPEELKLQMIDLVQKEALEMGLSAQEGSWTKSLTEEEISIKCWTLFEALLGLGIAQDCIKLAIGELLKNPPTTESGGYIWGFQESLDFLALKLPENELPSYMGRKAMLDNTESSSNQNTESNTPASSKVTTPEIKPVPSSR
jgi:ATP-dependent RNA helicase DHX29